MVVSRGGFGPQGRLAVPETSLVVTVTEGAAGVREQRTGMLLSTLKGTEQVSPTKTASPTRQQCRD